MLSTSVIFTLICLLPFDDLTLLNFEYNIDIYYINNTH